MGDRRRDAASRPARRPLTPGDVVAAGVELLDDVGLAGFTTRALADRLGTYPATLYWHVGNRSQVLAAIVEHVLGEMNVEDPRSIGWKEWLRHASDEYRRVVHAHPHLAPVLVSQLVVNAPATRLVETVLAVLDSAGFRRQDLASAFNAYVGSLVGWVSVELAASPPDIGEDWQEAFASTVLSLRAEEFPVIAANREYLADSVLTLRLLVDEPLEQLGVVRSFAKAATFKFSVHRINQWWITRNSERPVPEIVAAFDGPWRPGRISKMLGPVTAIRAVVIHHQDMRRALGIPRVVPEERVRAALDVVLTPRGSTNLGSCQRAAACDSTQTTSTGHGAAGPR